MRISGSAKTLVVLINDGVQLDLPFWPRGSLREALSAYKRSKAPHLAEESLRDYDERSNWLMRMLGDSTPLTEITFERLERIHDSVGPRGNGTMMGTTIKRRFVHLRAALKYAADRRIIDPKDVPRLPSIRNDSRPGQRVLGLVEFRQLRLALAGRFRDFADLAYWTGQHARDLWTLERWMLEPGYEWKDDDGNVIGVGRYWRRNHKNPNCAPGWFPMEPEFRETATQMLATPGAPNQLVIGHIWALAKAFARACDRCELARVSPTRDMRRSFASMLAARGYSDEYIRLAQGHEGSPVFLAGGRFVGAHRPSIDTRHYLRATAEMMIGQIKRRSAAPK